MNNKLISIVIPTRNRQFYCLKVIQHLISLNTEDIEIVIQDNSDVNSLQSDILKLSNTDIKYYYDNSSYTFSDNFNLSLAKASGEYVCVLGDDDGLLPEFINVVKWSAKNNIDAVIPLKHLHFFWPGARSVNGNLTALKPSDNSHMVNTARELFKFLKNGAQDYPCFGLPRIYHGIIKRSIIDAVRKKYGQIFGGLSPDIFSVVLLTSEIKEALYVDFPLTIAGACPGSGTASNSVGAHCGRLEDAPHFRNLKEIRWTEHLPKFYSVETIWGASAIEGLVKIKDYKSITSLNKISLISQALIKNRTIFWLILKETNIWIYQSNKNWIMIWTKIFIQTLALTFKTLFRKGLNQIRKIKMFNGIYYNNNVKDLEEVISLWGKIKIDRKIKCYSKFD